MFIPTIRFRHPNEKLPGDIDLTSNSSDAWCRELSPFLLGPCHTPNGVMSRTFQNLWEYSQVYAQHADGRGKPTKEWFQWRADGFRKPWGDKSPMGESAKPIHCQWRNRKLDCIEARKTVYAPVYYELVKNHTAMQRLHKLFFEKNAKGETLTLVDFDLHDPNGATYEEIINDPNRTCGHGFILGMILENQLAWEAKQSLDEEEDCFPNLF